MRLLAVLAFALSLLGSPAAAQQVPVTFRFLPDLTAPPISPVVRAFVPGAFNDWGPNANGVIAAGAPSQMTYDAALAEYRYTVSLAAGQNYAYKVHYHQNAAGTLATWITDPLNPLVTGADNNSVVQVRDPMVFQLAREQDASGAIVAVSAGVFGSQPVASLQFTVNGAPADGITHYNPTTRIFRYVLPVPVSYAQFSITATDAIGRTATGNVGTPAPVVVDAPRPLVNGQPVRDGVTVLPDGGTVFALWAPRKAFVHLTGSFNGWAVTDATAMRRDAASADSTWWWLRVDGLSRATAHTYQFRVEGERRIVDPFAPLVLDPSNDAGITTAAFPNRPAYPTGQQGIVGVHWPARFDYTWQTTDYVRRPQQDLVVYELLVRDFLAAHDYDTLTDTLDYLQRLGVNAVELMPVSEFAGNINWGYQPTFHLALDKYYGPPEQLKAFVDAAHARGMAVLLDVVYNHADSPSSLVDLYGCTEGGPYTNSPARDPFVFFCDLDHTNPRTQYWLDRANEYWLEEFRVDGFRFDLTGGFQQTGVFFPGANAINQQRVTLLSRMANRVWDVDPGAYVVFEHLVESPAEYRALAQIGRDRGLAGPMLWNNMNRPYSELAMGMPGTPAANRLPNAYPPNFFEAPTDRSYVANSVTYMESHDEQWLVRRNLALGAQAAGYNTRELRVALDRVKLAAAFFLTVPGPRMMWQFGELGYGYGTNECLPEEGLTCGVDRIAPKPIRWDYAADPLRRKLFDTYAALTGLRADYTIFRSASTEVTFVGTGSQLRTVRLSLPSAPVGEPTRVVITGNFGITAATATPGFPAAGPWYDFFYDGQLDASGPGQTVALRPGEFHIWTDVDVPSPDPGLITVADEDEAGPSAFVLGAPFPNPASGNATVPFTLGSAGRVRLEAFDVLGRRVAVLIDAALPAGAHAATVDARQLPAGVYVLRLTAGDVTATTRLTTAR